MLLTRLYLRNFRVFEDELDLELPPGLVGIYGPNGAGKSTLLEAIIWTLWGKARTTKEQIRSAGVGGDCVTEVEFEHEGHLYHTRRTLTGINSAPRLEARCDGLVMSQGVRDGERYLESVLGMDDGAFRASVFAEQKQLAAFSNQSPADRLRLVLRLLGITPLDGARDTARKDARRATADHDGLRRLLADVDALGVEAADAEARAAAAKVTADTAQEVAQAAQDRAKEAAATWSRLDRHRQEYEALVVEGRAARRELDATNQTILEQQTDLDTVLAAAERLPDLQLVAAGLHPVQHQLEILLQAAEAAIRAERCVVGPEPPGVDEAALAAVQADDVSVGIRLAGLESVAEAAAAELDRAREAMSRSSTLSGEADCPLCGQALGEAFEQVQAHRASEHAAAEQRLRQLSGRVDTARREATAAHARRVKATDDAEIARRARATWEDTDRRRQDAETARRDAWQAVLAVTPDLAAKLTAGADNLDDLPPAPVLAEQVNGLRSQLEHCRSAATEIERLGVRLERRSSLESSLVALREQAGMAADRVQALRDKLHALNFDQEALRSSVVTHDREVTESEAARQRAHQADLEAAREQARYETANARLVDAIEQHAKLATLESDARHLARVADLLSEFRNTVVASVGPRLALQAAELFGELTDHEYDELQVDPETYQLQISDAGKVYGLERFSGSEIDLANLALRVAISEHIHFQSGGSVGLLVLDEVFGPLDEDRKTRMLLALERLRGRFRQVLVVTHDASIKEQMPNAIEVVKLPGRRATARAMT